MARSRGADARRGRPLTLVDRQTERCAPQARLPRVPRASIATCRRTPCAPTTATSRSSWRTPPPQPTRKRRADHAGRPRSLARSARFLGRRCTRRAVARDGGAQAGGGARRSCAICAAKGVIDGDPARAGRHAEARGADAGAPVRGRDDRAARDAGHDDAARPPRPARSSSCSTRPGLRLSELVGLDLEDVNLSARMVRVLGKGGKERLVPFNHAAGDGDPRVSERSRTLVRGVADRRRRRRDPPGRRRPPAARKARLCATRGRRRAEHPLFVNYRGGRLTTRSVDRLVRRYVALCSTRARHQPARAAAFVRDAPAAARRRPARDPGAARPRAPQHDAALHARQRGAAARGVQEGAPAGEEGRGPARRLTCAFRRDPRRSASSGDCATAGRAGTRCRAS